MINIEKMLKAIDVAEILGCGINRARDIINKPEFPKIIIGNRIYVNPKEFEKWIDTYTYKEFKL